MALICKLLRLVDVDNRLRFESLAMQLVQDLKTMYCDVLQLRAIFDWCLFG